MPVRLFKKTQLVAHHPGMWPSSLIHREAGQHRQVANDVFDGDKTITKDRPRLKRTTKPNAPIVFLHTAIVKSHSS